LNSTYWSCYYSWKEEHNADLQEMKSSVTVIPAVLLLFAKLLSRLRLVISVLIARYKN
jgi:hypothetical protein